MNILKNYPGSKNNSGILQFFINRIPYHRHYYELFAGSATLYYAKHPAITNTLMDMDSAVIDAHKQKAKESTHPGNVGIVRLFNDSAINYLRSVQPLLDRSCFIYLDPPYPFDTKKGRIYYRHELSDDDHVQLLTACLESNANIMISTRQNDLYDQYLGDWYKETFATADHGGPAVEVIYMNYPPPAILHQYDHLGNGYIDRQAKKRKRTRFMQKIQQLPAYERHMFIQEMIAANAAEVQHFLSILASPAINDCMISKADAPPGDRADSPTADSDYTTRPHSHNDLLVPEGTDKNTFPAAPKKPGQKAAAEYLQPGTAPECHYCHHPLTGSPVANGLLDTDMAIYVCTRCKPEHYRKKQQTEYAGMYSEMPVVIPGHP